MVIVVPVPGVTEEGLNVAVAPVGKPLAVKVTIPVNAPPTGAVVIAYIADVPAGTVCAPVELDMVKSTMVIVAGPADDARKFELPANDAEMVLEPAVWLTLEIAQVAVPAELVVPLQVCAVPPLPRVNRTETLATGLPPVV
jgi:hypothetical protein